MKENNTIIRLVTGNHIFYEKGGQYYHGTINTEVGKVGDFNVRTRSNIRKELSDNNKTSISAKDVYKSRKDAYLNKFISNDYNNVMVLAGAGSSIASKGQHPKKQGRTMSQLAKIINGDLNRSKKYYNLIQMAIISRYYIKLNKLNYNLKGLKKLIVSNLEDLLSNLNRFDTFIKSFDGQDASFDNDIIKDVNSDYYDQTIKRIHHLIRDYCTIKYDPDNFSHGSFIKELQLLNTYDNRLKIYSTNYDTLFEQAANKNGSLVIDGFAYSSPRIFNRKTLNIDFVNRSNDTKRMNSNNTKLYSNVIKFFQLHGSVDWYRDTKTHKIYKTNAHDAERKIEKSHKYYHNHNRYTNCMIFPSTNKYEQSYENPFFDLFSNFRHDLNQRNTLLIVIGFSFGDKHINQMVYDAMQCNENLSMIFISHSTIKEKNHGTPLKHFFTKDLLRRELFYKGDLSKFTDAIDITNIHNN